MIIKENEESRIKEVAELRSQIESFTESESALKKTIQDLEAEICDKNKVHLDIFFVKNQTL